MPFIVYVELWFDGGKRAQNRSRPADPSAPVQMKQIIYRKYMNHIPRMFFQPLRSLFHGFSLITHPHGLMDKESLPHGGGQAVHHPNLYLRMFLHDLLCGHAKIAAGAA